MNIKYNLTRKVLIKNNLVVNQIEYTQGNKLFDKYFYYVYYSTRRGKKGLYSVYTNSTHFNEKRVLYLSESKEVVIKIAEQINNTLRLLAGYYDEDITYKNEHFPIIVDNI